MKSIVAMCLLLLATPLCAQTSSVDQVQLQIRDEQDADVSLAIVMLNTLTCDYVWSDIHEVPKVINPGAVFIEDPTSPTVHACRWDVRAMVQALPPQVLGLTFRYRFMSHGVPGNWSGDGAVWYRGTAPTPVPPPPTPVHVPVSSEPQQ